MKSKILGICFVLIVTSCVGCGDTGPFDYTPVTGKLSYEDDSLITEAHSLRLGFVSMDRGDDMTRRPRPAKAPINISDGTFDHVTSYKYADGLVAGKHKVVVVAKDEKGMPSLVVPEEYTKVATTPLVVDTAEAPFHIKVPKPAKK